MCSCWWQWKSVSPGLSAIKSTSASWYPPNITTSFKIPAVGFPARLVSSKLWRWRWIGWISSLALRIRNGFEPSTGFPRRNDLPCFAQLASVNTVNVHAFSTHFASAKLNTPYSNDTVPTRARGVSSSKTGCVLLLFYFRLFSGRPSMPDEKREKRSIYL